MNFHYLALFICHLFGDGHFRTVHIIFKPNTFNYTILEHIESICPHSIPFYLTDITRSWDWPWNQNDNPNNVLQLMFLDPKTFTTDTRQLNKFFALYRIFAFSATDVIETKTKTITSITESLRKFSGSNNLVLDFDAKNVSIYMDVVDAQHPKPIMTMNVSFTNFNRRNLFDQTFGHYERMLSISVKHIDYHVTFYGIQKRVYYRLNYESTYYISNYFNIFFNKTYVNFTWLRVLNNQFISNDFKLILDHLKYYKELTHKCRLISNNNNNQML